MVDSRAPSPLLSPKSSARDTLLARIGGRVRAARQRRGLTLKDAAERAALSVRFFGELEAGRANIAVGRLAQVAVALGVTLASLVEEEIASSGRTVALVGLRGAGKSTIGPRLAGALDMDFVELDDLIEEEAGLSLAELFALHGEPYYRRLETRCLAALLATGEPWVVALSGGVVHNVPAWEMARARCTTLWLKASPEEHMQRVIAQGDIRPVRERKDAMAELQELLRARQPVYAESNLTVDTSGLRTGQVLARALEALSA